MNKKILILSIIAVVLISGCIDVPDIENSIVSIEKVKAYQISNFTGSVAMNGNAQKYIMFVPYSDNYQEITAPVGLKTETDEYGNQLATVEGDYKMDFDFRSGSTKNSLKDAPYPFDVSSSFSAYLEKTEKINPENQQIIEIAENITSGRDSTFAVIGALNNWTNEYLDYIVLGTRDLGTEQILAERKGSCEEFTWLYTALARSAGIPTRIVTGWIDNGTKVDLHMWAESYVPGNGWIYVEPSNAEFGVMSAPHVKLYVGPDKLPEQYYGPVPERQFELYFKSSSYLCALRETEKCTPKMTHEIRGTIISGNLLIKQV